jgi:hypothetical protein
MLIVSKPEDPEWRVQCLSLAPFAALHSWRGLRPAASTSGGAIDALATCISPNSRPGGSGQGTELASPRRAVPLVGCEQALRGQRSGRFGRRLELGGTGPPRRLARATAGAREPELRRCTNAGTPFGSEALVAEMERRTGRWLRPKPPGPEPGPKHGLAAAG